MCNGGKTMSGLFGGKRESMPAPSAEGKPEGFIGSTMSIEGGTIKSDGNMRIDGRVDGEIESAGTVVIGKTGVVTANIRARHVFVAGEVRGDVEAPAGLEITSTGKLYGNITVGSLQIEQGGVFRGQSFMNQEGKEPLLLAGPAIEGETLEGR
jgi:cytoskeletal protein CcmA (bactofilin family)